MSQEPLIFINGFLGVPEDWEALIAALPFKRPCHFARPDALDVPEKGILIGYSMGGRIALEMADQHPERFSKIILLSCHLGLDSPAAQQSRWQTDLEWMDRFAKEPLTQVLPDWYAQPLFGPYMWGKIAARRLTHDPKILVQLMKRYSLAHQKVYVLPHNSLYLYGALDTKYAALYSHLPQTVAIDQAYHAVHLDNPLACAKALTAFLTM